jgi:hypothetical protein
MVYLKYRPSAYSKELRKSVISTTSLHRQLRLREVSTVKMKVLILLSLLVPLYVSCIPTPYSTPPRPGEILPTTLYPTSISPENTSSPTSQPATESNVWTQLGPWASVSDMAIDPLNPTTLYAGTDSGGVFKSINSGENWSRLNIDYIFTQVHCCPRQLQTADLVS